MLQQKRTFFYLLFLVCVWGINWPLSKFALAYTPPLLFAGMRTIIGGLLLILIALPRYKELRFKERWPIYLISALLSIMCFYGFQTIGLQYMPAGLFSAIVFLQPVLLGIFSWFWLGEKMYGLKMIGLLLGFVGVAVMGAGGMTSGVSMEGIILALGSALSWALGTIYMKKNAERVDSLWMTAMQITIGGVILLGSGSVVEQWSDIHWNLTFVLDTLFISIFVIAMGWLVYFKLISEGEASTVGSFTFLIPLISLFTSVIFLHEKITLNLIAGLVFIVASIVMVNYKWRRKNKVMMEKL